MSGVEIVIIVIWFSVLFWISRILHFRDFVYYDEDQIKTKGKIPKKEFPNVYEKLYDAHGLIFFAIFLTCTIFGGNLIYLVQLFLFTDTETFTLTSHTDPDMVNYLFFVSSLGGLTVSTLLLIESKFIAKGFKKYDDFQVLRKLIRYPNSKSIISDTEELSTTNDTVKLHQNRIFRLSVSVVIFWLIVPPWIIVSINNYTKTDLFGITIHSFSGDLNKNIPWSQVESATITCDTITGYSKGYSRHIIPELNLRTNDDWVRVWGGVGMGTPKIKDIVMLLDFMRTKGISITVIPLDDEQKKLLNSRDGVSKSQLQKIFSSSTYQ